MFSISHWLLGKSSYGRGWCVSTIVLFSYFLTVFPVPHFMHICSCSPTFSLLPPLIFHFHFPKKAIKHYFNNFLIPFSFLLVQFGWGIIFNISPSVSSLLNNVSVLDMGLVFTKWRKRWGFNFSITIKQLCLNMVGLGEPIGDRWMNKESLVWLVYTICLAIPLFLSFSLHSFASYPLFWGISLFILQKLFKFPSLFCALFSLHWSKDFWDFC